jgi:two-component system LytT family sensor kinase
MPTIPFSNLTLRILTGIFIYLLWQLNFFSIWKMGFPFTVSLVDSLVNTALLWISSMTIIQTFRYYQPPANRFWFILCISSVLAILLVILAKLILPAINTNDPAYVEFLNQSTGIRMGFAVLIIGFMVVLNLLWNMLAREMESKDRRVETQALAKEAELFKLRQQLQPHFLFNSLNSINAMINSQPKEARQMIEQLSVFLRATVNSKEGELLPLSEELEQVDRYLQIEKLRFGHRLQTLIQTDEACSQATLPPLILQPIVENAIKFGLYDTVGDVTIEISTSCSDGYLAVKVSNPYDAETSPSRKGTGFGLTAVQRRLYLLYGRQDLLSTGTENAHFITTLNIPQNYAQGNIN